MEYWIWKHCHWLWWAWQSVLQVTWYKLYNSWYYKRRARNEKGEQEMEKERHLVITDNATQSIEITQLDNVYALIHTLKGQLPTKQRVILLTSREMSAIRDFIR